jgi:hypothetical protein
MTAQLKLRMLRCAGVLAAGAVAAAAVAGCGAASQAVSASSPGAGAGSPVSPAPSASPAGAAPVSSAGAAPASSGAASALTAQSPVASQATPASAGLPAGSYFGVVVAEQIQADGSGTLQFEPETWQGTAAPVSHARLSYALVIGPSAAASFWAGTSPSSSHEVAGTFSLDYARRIQAAMAPFTTQPYSGYEVTVSAPAGCTGQCAQVTSIAQIGSLTPRSPDADFTEPRS